MAAVRAAAARQLDQVALMVATGGRVEVSEVVLMQPRLTVEDLAREALVVGKCWQLTVATDRPT